MSGLAPVSRLASASRLASMTGFASLSGVLELGRGFSLAIKGVNHRHLDLQMRLPPGLDALEAALRAAVKARVRRGHVELTMTLEKASSGLAVELDEALLEAYVVAFRQSVARYGLRSELDLNALLRMPGVMGTSSAAFDLAANNLSGMEASVLAVMDGLLTRFNATRMAEGKILGAELRAGMQRVTRLAEEARELREGVAGVEFARMKARIAELLGSAEVSEERLLTEAALLAGRSDVEEELVRLRTHVERFLQLLEGGGEVGRQLDFLLQELNREANTMLSKSGGSATYGMRMTEIGLEMKVELERAREQVQNLE